jgi:hypothetical protein
MIYGEVDTGASNRNMELQPIEEEREHRGSRKPSMTESEHRNNPNKSGSDEEKKNIQFAQFIWITDNMQ